MTLYTQAEAKRIVDRALFAAKKAGAEAIATLDQTHAGNTRFAVSEITSSGDVTRIALSVTVQYGQRAATATGNQVEDRAVDDLVARAARMARLAPENRELLAPIGSASYTGAAGASDAATAAMGPEGRAKAVAAMIALASSAGGSAGGSGGAAGDAAKVAIAGFYEHGTRVRAFGTTSGASGYHAWTNASLSSTARTPDGTGSGWAGASSHRAGDIDAAALAKIAVDKAAKSQKPGKLDPGRYTVVLEPAAVADLLGFMTNSLNARRADEGRSFFSKPGGGTRVGEKLFPDTITLRSDPTDPQLAALPFDREGLPLAPTTWIDKGVLRGLAYGRFWAKHQGKPATGAPDGWILEGGKASVDELVKGVARGVLITRFWYLRYLDPQTILATGLTRDGTFLIEKGAIVRPVNNFRFNESPVHMLAKCDGMTAPVVTATGMRVPALRTHEFNLASISEAV